MKLWEADLSRGIVLANLLYRPIKSAISILAIAFMIAFLLIITGLTRGKLEDIGKRVEGVGADIVFQPPGASAFLIFSNSKIPVSLGEKLLQVEGVASVAPVLVVVQSYGQLEVALGIDFDSFDKIGSPFVFSAGARFTAPDQLLLDQVKAEKLGVRAGDKVRLMGREFTVAGIVGPGKGSRIFMSLATAQELTNSAGRASLFFVKCQSPKIVRSVIERLKAVFPDYTVRPLKDYASFTSTENLRALNVFFASLVAIAVSVSFLVTLLTMYTAIVERTRIIGIMKSLGASKSYIVWTVLAESLLICAIGILLGFGIAFGFKRFMATYYVSLPVSISYDWLLRAALLGLASGVLGALYPALRAARLDPVHALNQY